MLTVYKEVKPKQNIFLENVYFLDTYNSSYKDTLWITHRHQRRIVTLNCQQVALNIQSLQYSNTRYTHSL